MASPIASGNDKASRVRDVEKKITAMTRARVRIGQSMQHSAVASQADIDMGTLTQDLSDEAKMKEKYFSHLIQESWDGIKEAFAEAPDLPEGTYLNYEETKVAVERAEDRFAVVCSLPMKLVLTKIRQDNTGSSKQVSGAAVNSAIGSVLARLCGFPCGAFHAALVIGDVCIEWNNSSLIIPWRGFTRKDAILEFDLDRFSYWNRFISRYKPHMRRASGRALDYRTQVDAMVIIHNEKESIIDSLVTEIVKYNTQYRYSLWNVNCQSFVWDLMRSIRIFRPELASLAKVVKDNLMKHCCMPKFLTSLPHFNIHEELDDYVRNNEVKEEDYDYLINTYNRFHRQASLEDGAECPVSNCQKAKLEELVRKRKIQKQSFT